MEGLVAGEQREHSPANLGTITLDPADEDDDFDVGIVSPYGAGAVNVTAIQLEAAGWTGYSAIPGGTISGNLGGIKVKPDAALDGGTIDLFTVQGTVVGQVTAHTVFSMTIEGTFGTKNSETSVL